MTLYDTTAEYCRNRGQSPVRLSIALALAATVLAAGCSTSRMVELRNTPRTPLSERLHLTAWTGPKPTNRTMQFLRVNDLQPAAEANRWSEVIPRLQTINEQRPSAESLYALAEAAFIAGKRAEKEHPDQAFDYYGLATVCSYKFLFDPVYRTTRNPYDPQFRGACELYNGALEAGLRLHCRDGGDIRPGQSFEVESAAGSWIVHCEIRCGRWRPSEIDHFEFASDYEIKGLKNQYRQYGLGAPLVAVRKSYEGEPACAKYYPPGLSFPITAFFRTLPNTTTGADGQSIQHHAILELYDTMAVQEARVENRLVPLETDLTTPLAVFLANPGFNQIATVGLLSPDKLLDVRSWAANSENTTISGLYMVQPFQPDKIPVVMVHGLWSSPVTWMEMFNDLRSDPDIRANYQFWFYLYPSAQPFWVSAAQMRDDLAEMRQTVDPRHDFGALDRMVLVGHSMGGLVSRLQTIDTEDRIWKLVSDAPFEQVQGDPSLQGEVRKWLFFRPNPSIRRVVTIGTPHRGSQMSNSATRWISDRLIDLPGAFTDYLAGFRNENGELIRDDSLLKIDNSVDSLSPESPFFPAMLASRRPNWVRYHNIVGVLPEGSLESHLAKFGDGVVEFDSASMDDVVSQVRVPADHTTIHAQPAAVLEVRRILLEHLHEIRTGSLPEPPNVRMAGRDPTSTRR